MAEEPKNPQNPTEKLYNRSEFAGLIKTKYPEYAEVDDSLLVEKILAKYPQYKDVIVPDVPEEPKTSRIGSFFRGTGNTLTTQYPGASRLMVGSTVHDLMSEDAQLEAINKQVNEGTLTLSPDPAYYDKQIGELDRQMGEWEKTNKALVDEHNKRINPEDQGTTGNLYPSFKPKSPKLQWDKQQAWDQYVAQRDQLNQKKQQLVLLRDKIEKDGFEGTRQKIQKAPENVTYFERMENKGREQLKASDELASRPENQNGWYKAGQFAGNIVPSMAAALAAIPTGGTSLAFMAPLAGAATAAGLSAASGGSAMWEYEKYRQANGMPVDPMERSVIGVGNAIAEFVPEFFHVSSVIPATAIGKQFAKSFTKEVVKDPRKALSLLEAFAKDNPQLAKQLFKNIGKQSLQEGEEEATTQLAQDLMSNYYKKPEDYQNFGAILKDMGQAAALGALMGGFIGIPTTFAQNVTQKRIREKRGSVTLAEDTGTGQVVELMGEDSDGNLLAYSRDGRELHLKPENLGQRVTVPINQFNATLKGQTVQLDKEIQSETENEKMGLDQEIQTKMGQITHKDGGVYEAQDIHGNGFYIIEGNPYGDGMVVAIGPDNQPVQRAAKSLFGKDEKSQPQRFEAQDYYNMMRQAGEMKANQEEIIRRANTGTLTQETILRETLQGGETGIYNGMEVRYTGQQRENGDIQVKFPDPENPAEEATLWIQPEEMQFTQNPASQTSETEQTEQTEEPMQPVPVPETAPKRTLIVGKTELPLAETGENTWDIEKEFTTSEQAKAARKKLAEKYPRLTFAVEDRSDKADPFSPAQYTITVKPKTNDTNLSGPVASTVGGPATVRTEPEPVPLVPGTQSAPVDTGTQPELKPVEVPITENLNEPNVESIPPTNETQKENQGREEALLTKPVTQPVAGAESPAALVAEGVSEGEDELPTEVEDFPGIKMFKDQVKSDTQFKAAILSKAVVPERDIYGNETGWYRDDTGLRENYGFVRIYNGKTGEVVDFKPDNENSGTDMMRAGMAAQVHAMEHRTTGESQPTQEKPSAKEQKPLPSAKEPTKEVDNKTKSTRDVSSQVQPVKPTPTNDKTTEEVSNVGTVTPVSKPEPLANVTKESQVSGIKNLTETPNTTLTDKDILEIPYQKDGKPGVLKVRASGIGIKILYGRKQKWDNLSSTILGGSMGIQGLYHGSYNDVPITVQDAQKIVDYFDGKVSESQQRDINGIKRQIEVLNKKDTQPGIKQAQQTQVTPEEVQKVSPKTEKKPNPDEEGYANWLAENGTDPDEIVLEYARQRDNTPFNKLQEWQQELIQGKDTKISRESFERFGDPNWIGRAIIVNWFSRDPYKKGETIDGLSEYLSELHHIKITEDDLVEFIRDHPSRYVRVTTDSMKPLARRYKQLTGNDIKSHTFKGEEFSEGEKEAAISLPSGLLESLYREGIRNMDDLERLREQYFTGFPYTPEEYETVKKYLKAHPEGITINREAEERSQDDQGVGTEIEGLGEKPAPKVETLPDFLTEDWTEDEPGAPIGIETQIENVLTGQSEQEKAQAQEKIQYTKDHVGEIETINGTNVYDVIVDGENIRYNLKKMGTEAVRKYYYPIQYADITFRETQAPESEPTQSEIGLSQVPTYQDLTPDQKREFEARKKELEQKIKDKQEEIGQAKRALQTQKNKLEKSRVSQTGLLDEPAKPKFVGDILFSLPPKDFSEENIKRAIQEQEGVLAVKARELQDLMTRKDRIIEEILYGVKAQTRL